jgi:hypothetical protein
VPQGPQPRSSATTGLTVAAVVGVTVCSAGTLLVSAGVLASAGVLLDNLLIIALAAGVLGWALTRAVRSPRAGDRSTGPDPRNET